MKKFFAMTMASVMALSMGVTAFAAGNELKYTGSTEAPIIAVTLPTTTNLIINPYKLTVKDPSDSSGSATISSQVISPEVYIFSASNVALQADVTATGTVSGTATFATTDPTTATKPSTKNDLYLYAEVTEAGTLGDKLTNEEATDAEAAAGKGKTFTAGYDSNTDLLIGAKAATKTAMFELDAVDFDDDGATDASFVGFRLAGTANDKAPTAWTAADKADVAFTFNFKPIAAEATP